MEELKDAAIKDYSYTSRYSPFPYFYNVKDDKYIYGITGWLSQNNEYSIHTITDTDTLDGLAFKYYGRPDLYWVIADFNRIIDPWVDLWKNYNFLYIPSLAGIRYRL